MLDNQQGTQQCEKMTMNFLLKSLFLMRMLIVIFQKSQFHFCWKNMKLYSYDEIYFYNHCQEATAYEDHIKEKHQITYAKIEL